MTQSQARQPLVDASTLVVKIGSALITNNGTGLDLDAINSWAQQLAQLIASGRRVLLVSSGAIACGMQQLGWPKRPGSIPELQAAAAVGQMGLAQTYQQAFGAHGIRTAQILLTHEDLADRSRYLNARATISTLLDLGVLPIINENDTVATAEIRFGDNDTLGALVANLIEADALIILTDQEGLYTADPRKDASATLVSLGNAGDEQYEQMAGGSGTHVGTGGMITKIWAAKRPPAAAPIPSLPAVAQPMHCRACWQVSCWVPCSWPASNPWPPASSGWPTICNWLVAFNWMPVPAKPFRLAAVFCPSV